MCTSGHILLQALLARFSEESSLLARENDRLSVGRVSFGSEHADVLQEIEALQERLSGLESAVKAGQAQPGAVKVGILVCDTETLCVSVFVPWL